MVGCEEGYRNENGCRENEERRMRGSERTGNETILRRRRLSLSLSLAATTFDWAGLVGLAWLAGCGTVLLHTYSARRATVVAFIYRRLLLSGASAAF